MSIERRIKLFKNISKHNTAIAGGKGASLGEMTQVGFPVPLGFVILASVFDEFLKETDLNVEIETRLKRINFKDINSVEKTSKEIYDLINDKNIPDDLAKEILKQFKKLKTKYAAVRSSATAEDSSIASWAGELETYLNTTQKNLLENVKKCWFSLYTPRAIFYRNERGLFNTKISVAVIIQKMIQSDVSGICFTVHPVTENKNQMIIEAGWGLGEIVVSGKITPDSYVIDKKSFEILDKNISEQRLMIVRSKSGVKEIKVPRAKQKRQKLNKRQIIRLAKLCQKIEKHYKKPQDIEFTVENNKIYIVQSRPITTL